MLYGFSFVRRLPGLFTSTLSNLKFVAVEPSLFFYTIIHYKNVYCSTSQYARCSTQCIHAHSLEFYCNYFGFTKCCHIIARNVTDRGTNRYSTYLKIKKSKFSFNKWMKTTTTTSISSKMCSSCTYTC